MTTNMTVRNGVSGILVPLSFHSSEAIEPVLITTQLAVYTDNRNVVIDSKAVKEMIKNVQEESTQIKEAFHPAGFLMDFHKQHSINQSRLSMLLGYLYKGRTFPISVSMECNGTSITKTTTQVVYADQVKGITVDVKLTGKKVPDWEEVIDLIQESVPHLEGESLDITDTAFYIKERIDKELEGFNQVQEVFIKKGANITIIGE